MRPEEVDHEVLCVDGCGRIATDERLDSLTADGTEINSLVCIWHAEHPADEET